MIDEPISDIMNREVVHGEPSTTIPDVIAEMHDAAQSAFVVCEDGRPVGMITERDAVSILFQTLFGACYENVLVGLVMARPVHTLPETATIHEVVSVMNERRFRRVPIVGSDGRLVGIVNLTELQSGLNAALEKRGRDLEAAVRERTNELEQANAKLEALSRTDGLTGLLNRRAMSERLDELHEVFRRYGNSYAVALIDIDHFKNYNDTLGHPMGDEAIREIARLIGVTVRNADAVFRYGGEEFLVAMPETRYVHAETVSERLRSAIERRAVPHPSSPVGPVVTLSIGFASVDRTKIARGEGWNELVDAADQALYRAKEAGRNRVAGAIAAS